MNPDLSLRILAYSDIRSYVWAYACLSSHILVSYVLCRYEKSSSVIWIRSKEIFHSFVRSLSRCLPVTDWTANLIACTRLLPPHNLTIKTWSNIRQWKWDSCFCCLPSLLLSSKLPKNNLHMHLLTYVRLLQIVPRKTTDSYFHYVLWQN